MDLRTAWQCVPSLRVLSPSSTRALKSAATLRTFGVGDTVFAIGSAPNCMLFVISGRVALDLPRAGGRNTTIEIVGPGDCVCPNMIVTGRAMCCHAVSAAPNTQVLSIERTAALHALYPSGGKGEAMCRSMAERCAKLCRRVAELTGGRVEQRVALLLLRLTEQARVATNIPTDSLPRLEVRRRELANLASTSTESSSRALAALARAGAITVDKRRGIIILDHDRLRQIAESDCR